MLANTVTKCRCRRRIYSIVVLLAVLCLIVLAFQFFLFVALSVYHEENGNTGWFDRGARPKYVEDELGVIGERHLQRVERVERGAFGMTVLPLERTSDCKEKNCSTVEQFNTRNKYTNLTRIVNVVKLDSMENHVDSKIRSFTDVWQYFEHAFSRDYKGITDLLTNSKNVRGANWKWSLAYQQDEDGFFSCILSREKIPFSRVNDDYCDCSDHSDEPGTSACSNGRFYCSFQSTAHNAIPKWLPSSRVNDGLCDCCDGSDEWSNQTLPSHILIRDNAAHYNIYQAPCIDRCDDLRRREVELAEIRQRGLALKQDYIKAGHGQNNPANLYGTDAVFYKVSTLCMDVRYSKYSYSVCPFGPVKQTDSGNSPVVIGQSPKWLSYGPTVHRLVLNDGDSTNCPGSQSRKTIVEFECGIEDHVASISENEVCQYLVRFTSPAAC